MAGARRPVLCGRAVSQLTEQGLLERRQDTGDKRIAHLHPTPRARRELAEVRHLEGAHIAQALCSLTEESWARSVRPSAR